MSTEFNSVNQFLVDRIAIDGVRAEQLEDGTLHVEVPPVETDSSLFYLPDRRTVKEFHGLCAASGQVALSIHAPSVGPDVTWQIFHAVGVELPEDAAEYAFLKQLGSSLDQNTSIGNPSEKL